MARIACFAGTPTIFGINWPTTACTASLIVDGHHLPPEVVKTFVRAKSPERCILVSDLSGMAGMPPGRYATEFCDLEILSDGRLVIAGQDQLLAGASHRSAWAWPT